MATTARASEIAPHIQAALEDAMAKAGLGGLAAGFRVGAASGRELAPFGAEAGREAVWLDSTYAPLSRRAIRFVEACLARLLPGVEVRQDRLDGWSAWSTTGDDEPGAIRRQWSWLRTPRAEPTSRPAPPDGAPLEAPRVRFLGTSDERDTCDHCGKKNLKRTVVLSIDDGEPVFYGTQCAANALAMDAKAVRQESKKADDERAKAEAHARYLANKAEQDRWFAWLAAHGTGDSPIEQIRSLGGMTAARARYAASSGS